ncbi:glycosyltransferase family 2 protein [Bryobacter aggregatus]|uniref:glycosyltransferase family 2 protein n=1 Tax=Bryobacter aggregatus TaxID=360054 RepID=UPI0004E286BE|nr:glycosyltransferase family A protein [Bryobacter aggregatus]
MITVAIPIYNAAETLHWSLASVFAQTFQDWELFLMDDGSSDRSLDIALSVRDPRVRVVTDGSNRGLVERLNQSVGLAGRPFYARMDADDLMHPDRLQIQVDQLRDSNVDVVGSAVYVIDATGTITGVRKPGTGRRGLRQAQVHPTVAARTAWFRSNPYDPMFLRAEDLELWYRTQSYTRMYTNPDPLLFYRESGCFSLRKYTDGMRSLRKLHLKYGPAAQGWAATFADLGLTYAKTSLYRAAFAMGYEDRLVRGRAKSVGSGDLAAAHQILQTIGATVVPGLGVPAS